MSVTDIHVVAGLLMQTTPDDKMTFPCTDYIRRFYLKRWMSSEHSKTLLVMHMMIPSNRVTEYTSQLRAMFNTMIPIGHDQGLKARRTLDDILRSRPERNTSLYFINKLNLTASDGLVLTFGERVVRHHNRSTTAANAAWVPSSFAFMDYMTQKQISL